MDKIVCIVIAVKLIASLRLNSTGFQHCIINLALYDLKLDVKSTDKIQQILFPMQEHQLWTIFEVDSSNQDPNEMSLDNPHYLKESCSVNIVIFLDKCFERSLESIFSTRMFDTRNTVIIVIRKDTQCALTLSKDSHAALLIDIYYIQDSSVAYAICPSCSAEYQKIQYAPKSLTEWNLEQMRAYSAMIKKISVEPIVALV